MFGIRYSPSALIGQFTVIAYYSWLYAAPYAIKMALQKKAA
jgi:hypothetical protein